MKQIRSQVFETNSSSTHSFCICTQKDYNAWMRGECVFDHDKKTGKYIIPKQQAIEYVLNRYHAAELRKAVMEKDQENIDEQLCWDGFYTYDYYAEREQSEAEEQEYATITTENGDVVVGFWYYGHD